MANKKGSVKRKRKLFKYQSSESNYFKVRSYTKEKSKESDLPDMKMFDPFLRKRVRFYAARLPK